MKEFINLSEYWKINRKYLKTKKNLLNLVIYLKIIIIFL